MSSVNTPSSPPTRPVSLTDSIAVAAAAAGQSMHEHSTTPSGKEDQKRRRPPELDLGRSQSQLSQGHIQILAPSSNSATSASISSQPDSRGSASSAGAIPHVTPVFSRAASSASILSSTTAHISPSFALSATGAYDSGAPVISSPLTHRSSIFNNSASMIGAVTNAAKAGAEFARVQMYARPAAEEVKGKRRGTIVVSSHGASSIFDEFNAATQVSVSTQLANAAAAAAAAAQQSAAANNNNKQQHQRQRSSHLSGTRQANVSRESQSAATTSQSAVSSPANDRNASTSAASTSNATSPATAATETAAQARRKRRNTITSSKGSQRMGDSPNVGPISPGRGRRNTATSAFAPPIAATAAEAKAAKESNSRRGTMNTSSPQQPLSALVADTLDRLSNAGVRSSPSQTAAATPSHSTTAATAASPFTPVHHPPSAPPTLTRPYRSASVASPHRSPVLKPASTTPSHAALTETRMRRASVDSSAASPAGAPATPLALQLMLQSRGASESDSIRIGSGSVSQLFPSSPSSATPTDAQPPVNTVANGRTLDESAFSSLSMQRGATMPLNIRKSTLSIISPYSSAPAPLQLNALQQQPLQQASISASSTPHRSSHSSRHHRSFLLRIQRPSASVTASPAALVPQPSPSLSSSVPNARLHSHVSSAAAGTDDEHLLSPPFKDAIAPVSTGGSNSHSRNHSSSQAWSQFHIDRDEEEAESVAANDRRKHMRLPTDSPTTDLHSLHMHEQEPSAICTPSHSLQQLRRQQQQQQQQQQQLHSPATSAADRKSLSTSVPSAEAAPVVGTTAAADDLCLDDAKSPSEGGDAADTASPAAALEEEEEVRGKDRWAIDHEFTHTGFFIGRADGANSGENTAVAATATTTASVNRRFTTSDNSVIDEAAEEDDDDDESEYSDDDGADEGEHDNALGVDVDASSPSGDESAALLPSPSSPSSPSSSAALSSEESLAELDLVKMSPFTLQFENAKMERIFGRHFESKLASSFLFLHLLVILQHSFLGVIEYVTGTTRGIAAPILAYRASIILTFLCSASFVTLQRKKEQANREKKMKEQQKEEEEEQQQREKEAAAKLQQQQQQLHPTQKHNERAATQDVVVSIGDSAAADASPAVAAPAPAASSPTSSSPSPSPSSSSSAPPRVYLLNAVFLLNLIQAVIMLICFTLGSKVYLSDTISDAALIQQDALIDVTQPLIDPESLIHGADEGKREEFTLYTVAAGDLSTAFSLVFYSFVFVASGMMLLHALPLALFYFISSWILSAVILRAPTEAIASSLVLQFLFLFLCVWNMYSTEAQGRKELILLCTVARDRARGNDLINNMLPPSMVLRLQIMQQQYESELALLAQAARSEAEKLQAHADSLKRQAEEAEHAAVAANARAEAALKDATTGRRRGLLSRSGSAVSGGRGSGVSDDEEDDDAPPLPPTIPLWEMDDNEEKLDAESSPVGLAAGNAAFSAAAAEKLQQAQQAALHADAVAQTLAYEAALAQQVADEAAASAAQLTQAEAAASANARTTGSPAAASSATAVTTTAAGNVIPLSPTSSSLLSSSQHFYDCYPCVSILFCYISSFTELVLLMETSALVKVLNDIFSAFDDSILIADGMYKVEAIAETYMAVSGCPKQTQRHAQIVAEFALQMQEIVRRNAHRYQHAIDIEWRKTIEAREGKSNSVSRMHPSRSHSAAAVAASSLLPSSSPALSSRPSSSPPKIAIQIGLHTGAIAAGVIGTKTLSYHLFGDSVNTSSRMCSTSSPEKIQCSATTAALLKDEFVLQPQGKKEVKGKGMMETYFVAGKKTAHMQHAHTHTHAHAHVDARSASPIPATAPTEKTPQLQPQPHAPAAAQRQTDIELMPLKADTDGVTATSAAASMHQQQQQQQQSPPPPLQLQHSQSSLPHSPLASRSFSASLLSPAPSPLQTDTARFATAGAATTVAPLQSDARSSSFTASSSSFSTASSAPLLPLQPPSESPRQEAARHFVDSFETILESMHEHTRSITMSSRRSGVSGVASAVVGTGAAGSRHHSRTPSAAYATRNLLQSPSHRSQPSLSRSLLPPQQQQSTPLPRSRFSSAGDELTVATPMLARHSRSRSRRDGGSGGSNASGSWNFGAVAAAAAAAAAAATATVSTSSSSDETAPQQLSPSTLASPSNAIAVGTAIASPTHVPTSPTLTAAATSAAVTAAAATAAAAAAAAADAAAAGAATDGAAAATDTHELPTTPPATTVTFDVSVASPTVIDSPSPTSSADYSDYSSSSSASATAATEGSSPNGGDGGVQFVAEFPASTYTLRLSDPALEQEFHNNYLRKSRRHLGIIVPTILALSVAYAIVGLVTLDAQQLHYFVPQCVITVAILAALEALMLLSEGAPSLRVEEERRKEAARLRRQGPQTEDPLAPPELRRRTSLGHTAAGASAGANASPTSTAGGGGDSPVAVGIGDEVPLSFLGCLLRPSTLASSVVRRLVLSTRTVFDEHNQLVLGASISGVIVCVNMSCLYTLPSSPPAFQSLDFSADSLSLVGRLQSILNFNCLAIMVVFFGVRLYYRHALWVAAIVWADLFAVFIAADVGVKSATMSLSVLLVCTLLSAYAQYRREYTERFDFLLERVLMHEKNNLFQLLQNMLPSPSHAHQLMLGEQVIERQDNVTMLYSDIRGYTHMSTFLKPEALCSLLNMLYSAFDEHLDIRGVYKIDTIGDAFVVVGGLTIENSTADHARAIADFALDMLQEIEQLKKAWTQQEEEKEKKEEEEKRPLLMSGETGMAATGAAGTGAHTHTHVRASSTVSATHVLPLPLLPDEEPPPPLPPLPVGQSPSLGPVAAASERQQTPRAANTAAAPASNAEQSSAATATSAVSSSSSPADATKRLVSSSSSSSSSSPSSPSSPSSSSSFPTRTGLDLFDPECSSLIRDVTMRIGVHSGKVVAATVGLIRPKYLLFGLDTIIANKMESSGLPGCVQVSQSTYELLNRAHTHLLEPRGEVDLGPALGGRRMKTYLLKGRYLDLLRATRERFAAAKRAEEDAFAATAAAATTAAAGFDDEIAALRMRTLDSDESDPLAEEKQDSGDGEWRGGDAAAAAAKAAAIAAAAAAKQADVTAEARASVQQSPTEEERQPLLKDEEKAVSDSAAAAIPAATAAAADVATAAPSPLPSSSSATSLAARRQLSRLQSRKQSPRASLSVALAADDMFPCVFTAAAATAAANANAAAGASSSNNVAPASTAAAVSAAAAHSRSVRFVAAQIAHVRTLSRDTGAFSLAAFANSLHTSSNSAAAASGDLLFPPLQQHRPSISIGGSASSRSARAANRPPLPHPHASADKSSSSSAATAAKTRSPHRRSNTSHTLNINSLGVDVASLSAAASAHVYTPSTSAVAAAHTHSHTHTRSPSAILSRTQSQPQLLIRTNSATGSPALVSSATASPLPRASATVSPIPSAATVATGGRTASVSHTPLAAAGSRRASFSTSTISANRPPHSPAPTTGELLPPPLTASLSLPHSSTSLMPPSSAAAAAAAAKRRRPSEIADKATTRSMSAAEAAVKMRAVKEKQPNNADGTALPTAAAIAAGEAVTEETETDEDTDAGSSGVVTRRHSDTLAHIDLAAAAAAAMTASASSSARASLSHTPLPPSAVTAPTIAAADAFTVTASFAPTPAASGRASASVRPSFSAMVTPLMRSAASTAAASPAATARSSLSNTGTATPVRRSSLSLVSSSAATAAAPAAVASTANNRFAAAAEALLRRSATSFSRGIAMHHRRSTSVLQSPSTAATNMMLQFPPASTAATAAQTVQLPTSPSTVSSTMQFPLSSPAAANASRLNLSSPQSAVRADVSAASTAADAASAQQQPHRRRPSLKAMVRNLLVGSSGGGGDENDSGAATAADGQTRQQLQRAQTSPLAGNDAAIGAATAAAADAAAAAAAVTAPAVRRTISAQIDRRRRSFDSASASSAAAAVTDIVPTVIRASNHRTAERRSKRASLENTFSSPTAAAAARRRKRAHVRSPTMATAVPNLTVAVAPTSPPAAIAPSVSNDAASSVPSLRAPAFRAFDDIDVYVHWLRAQHESELDSSLTLLEKQQMKQQQDQQVWSAKLTAIAQRRAMLQREKQEEGPPTLVSQSSLSRKRAHARSGTAFVTPSSPSTQQQQVKILITTAASGDYTAERSLSATASVLNRATASATATRRPSLTATVSAMDINTGRNSPLLRLAAAADSGRASPLPRFPAAASAADVAAAAASLRVDPPVRTSFVSPLSPVVDSSPPADADTAHPASPTPLYPPSSSASALYTGPSPLVLTRTAIAPKPRSPMDDLLQRLDEGLQTEQARLRAAAQRERPASAAATTPEEEEETEVVAQPILIHRASSSPPVHRNVAAAIGGGTAAETGAVPSLSASASLTDTGRSAGSSPQRQQSGPSSTSSSRLLNHLTLLQSLEQCSSSPTVITTAGTHAPTQSPRLATEEKTNDALMPSATAVEHASARHNRRASVPVALTSDAAAAAAAVDAIALSTIATASMPPLHRALSRQHPATAGHSRRTTHTRFPSSIREPLARDIIEARIFSGELPPAAVINRRGRPPLPLPLPFPTAAVVAGGSDGSRSRRSSAGGTVHATPELASAAASDSSRSRRTSSSASSRIGTPPRFHIAEGRLQEDASASRQLHASEDGSRTRLVHIDDVSHSRLSQRRHSHSHSLHSSGQITPMALGISAATTGVAAAADESRRSGATAARAASPMHLLPPQQRRSVISPPSADVEHSRSQSRSRTTRSHSVTLAVSHSALMRAASDDKPALSRDTSAAAESSVSAIATAAVKGATVAVGNSAVGRADGSNAIASARSASPSITAAKPAGLHPLIVATPTPSPIPTPSSPYTAVFAPPSVLASASTHLQRPRQAAAMMEQFKSLAQMGIISSPSVNLNLRPSQLRRAAGASLSAAASSASLDPTAAATAASSHARNTTAMLSPHTLTVPASSSLASPPHHHRALSPMIAAHLKHAAARTPSYGGFEIRFSGANQQQGPTAALLSSPVVGRTLAGERSHSASSHAAATPQRGAAASTLMGLLRRVQKPPTDQ